MNDISLKCIVVDDSSLQRLSIIKLINGHPNLEMVAEFHNALKAREALFSSDIDLVFLDIEMPIMSGFDLLKDLIKKPEIIIISGKSDYALKAFEYNAVDYLHKPVSKERFNAAVQKACNGFLFKSEDYGQKSDDEYIMVKSGLKNYKVFLRNINYVEANGDYVKVRTSTHDYTVLSSLKKFGEGLPDYFLRVHKSYLVNLKKVKNYSHSSIELGNMTVPISRTKKSHFTDLIAQIPGN